MVARALWSPSRVKAALQCGRRLQGLEEGWEGTQAIQGVRGRAVHRAIETIEADRAEGVESPPSFRIVAAVWADILAGEVPAGFDFKHVTEVVGAVEALWATEAEIAAEEENALASLHGEYKNPKASKEYKDATAHLAGVKEETAATRAEVEELVNAVDWPWKSERGVLTEGFDHSLDTVRRGAPYLAELWPTPDVVGAEWHLEADLGNGYRVHGYIDRVESSPLGIEVVDYKSSKYQDTPLDHWLQAATYAVIAEDHMGFAPDVVRLAYLRDRASDVFKVDPDWRDRLAALVAAADARLEAREFTPTFAGCGICDFYPICSAEFALVEIKEMGA